MDAPSSSASLDALIVVLAHNEERRIAACLTSLPRGTPGVEIHCVVNGSSDRTADIARTVPDVTVHERTEGGKSRTWNAFILDRPAAVDPFTYVLVDGDAEVLPGSIDAMVAALRANSGANAAAGLPRNGRRSAAYAKAMTTERTLFGDLYALRGSFVARMRDAGIRLPDDLVGDDGLIGALAKTDLADESDWQDARIVPVPDAGFLCEPTSLLSPRTIANQYGRMRNYAKRHFQNRIVSAIMRGPGPTALPRRLASLYPEWLPKLSPRRSPQWWWFDRLALARMRSEARD